MLVAGAVLVAGAGAVADGGAAGVARGPARWAHAAKAKPAKARMSNRRATGATRDENRAAEGVETEDGTGCCRACKILALWVEENELYRNATL